MDLNLVLKQRGRVERFLQKHRVGLLTLLFTDLVGSTKLKQELGDKKAVSLIQQHHSIVREILSDYKEREEISTSGDSFFIVFAKPSDAVHFSLRLQAALRAISASVPRPLLDRIGIHIGEVLIEHTPELAKTQDLYGLQVDVCARVMSLALGDQILLTRSAFDNARQVLKGQEIAGAGELSWLNHGPYLLKGVEEPLEICEVGELGRAPLKPPPDSEKVHRHVSPDSEPVLGWRPALGQLVPGTEWALEEKLGEGGFGEVWVGRHRTLKERRVFKFCFRADRVRSLKRELTLFRLLKERVGDHPNIVRLLEVNFDEPPFYLVMDHVGGRDLKTWSDERGGVENVPLEVRLEIVAQIADALQAAHDAGVIHRDVKPGNILVHCSSRREEALTSLAAATPGKNDPPHQPSSDYGQAGVGCYEVKAKLTDFGIGQVVSEEALKGMTKAGFTQTIVAESSSSQTGSQMYMAPELLAGKPASTRSDIYSLGVVLYQLLAGDLTKPLSTDWAVDISDPSLREDLQHCFAGNPQDRFTGAGQLATHLRSLPERRAELQRQQAEQAAREHAAYRRGIVRTASIASVIIVVIGLLTGFALKAARDLRRNLYFADIFTAGEALSAHDLSAARRVIEKYRDRRPWEEEFRGLEYRWLWSQCRSEELATLAVHTNGATCVVFSPDGKWLATGGFDEIVTVLDVATRKIVAKLGGFDGRLDTRAVAFSPDGRFLAAKGGTRVIVWSTRTWQPAAQLTGKPNWNWNDSLVFSPDSQTLATRIQLPGEHATRGRDAVGFWRTVDWSPGNPMIGPGRQGALGTVMTYSLDGSMLACSVWNELQIRDAQSLAVITNLVRKVDTVNRVASVAFSSRHMAVGYRDGMLKLFELGTWREVARVRACVSFLVALAFSLDGKVVATGGDSQAIQLWDVSELLTNMAEPETIMPLRTLRGHAGQLAALAFAPDGRTLVSASNDGTIRLWSRGSRASEQFLSGQRRPLWFSSTGDALITWHGAEHQTEMRLKRLDLVRGIETDLPVQPAQITNRSSYAVSSDAKQLAVGKRDGAVELWPLEAPGAPRVFSGDGQEIAALTFSPRGGLLAAISGGEGQRAVKVWDLASEQLLSETKGVGDKFAFSFSPDGKRLATLDARGQAKVWQVRTGEESAFPDTRMVAYSLTFSPDSQWLALGARSGNWLWKIGTPVLEILDGPSEVVNASVYSPDGRTLIGNTTENLTLFWDVRSRKLLMRVPSYRPGLSFLLLSPDGSLLAVPSRSRDRDLELWRFPTLEEIAGNPKRSNGNP